MLEIYCESVFDNATFIEHSIRCIPKVFFELKVASLPDPGVRILLEHVKEVDDVVGLAIQPHVVHQALQGRTPRQQTN